MLWRFMNHMRSDIHGSPVYLHAMPCSCKHSLCVCMCVYVCVCVHARYYPIKYMLLLPSPTQVLFKQPPMVTMATASLEASSPPTYTAEGRSHSSPTARGSTPMSDSRPLSAPTLTWLEPSAWVRPRPLFAGKMIDVFVSTEALQLPPPIRLVGGLTPYEGRVEVLIQGQWGTVCDDAWGNLDAQVSYTPPSFPLPSPPLILTVWFVSQVVCRQLGYQSSGALALSFAHFGRGTGPIVMDNVNCSGLEVYLTNCPSNGLYLHNCIHAEDASVRCQRELPSTSLSLERV